MIVDDNEFNLMPLRLIIRDFFIDQELLENGFRIKSQKSSSAIQERGAPKQMKEPSEENISVEDSDGLSGINIG